MGVVDDFFEFLNTVHPEIKWTCKKEQNGKLAIFDIQLIREGTKLDTTVYNKSSASDRYIHYTSLQALVQETYLRRDGNKIHR